MSSRELEQAIDAIPGGAWAIGVSGGADSVALLRLASARSDLHLIVAHLDHETRAGQSAADAAFVAELANTLRVRCVIARRSEIEGRLDRRPTNRSAHFRACRLRLFANVVRDHCLAGVLLAHHADDQAETIFQRLLRGSGPMGLSGISTRVRIGAGDALTICRPLLGVGGASLRQYLHDIAQPWREDASNRSADYQRNRVRAMLSDQPALRERLVGLGSAMRDVRKWVRSTAPSIGGAIALKDIEGLPSLVAEQALRRWLNEVGVAADAIEPAVVARLRTMLMDAASPPRQHFPGKVLLRRREGRVFREE